MTIPAAISTTAELVRAAREWLAQDPDPDTRAELESLIEHEDTDGLADRFDTRLKFGTAGLRGSLGAGPNRMNRVLVAQAAAGLAAYLVSREDSPSAVIGYDGRKNSHVFATDTAEILQGAGVRAILLPRPLPTPVLAFAVRHLDASAGVMVTASHNPASDNGYKVYLGGEDDGSQIVPPSDGEIAAQIALVAAGDIRSLPRSSDYEFSADDVVDAYVDKTAAVGHAAAPIQFVYTAMHGVGWETARRVFAASGFGEPAVVGEQIEPDATFPTVVFPNPEEPGAMDLAFARAAAVGADLVIANDPDADRLAVGVPVAAGALQVPGSAATAALDPEFTGEGGWRRLSGNEVGSLLGWRAAERLVAERGTASPDTVTTQPGTLVNSLVSSPALAAVAASYGLDHAETLTGFKWISRAPGLAYGYEEALGYLVDPAKIRDKDGISAAVDFLALVSELKAAGKTLADHADDFALRFGAFASSQISLRVSELAEIPRLMARLRSMPPTMIGDVAVTSIDDFLRPSNSDRGSEGGLGEGGLNEGGLDEDGLSDFGPNDILRIWMADGSRIIVRPSGTEPKLKAYIDASSSDGTARERMDAAAAKVAALDVGMRALLA